MRARLAGGSWLRRTVRRCSPRAPAGSSRIATADLTVTTRSLEGIAVDAIAITPDGKTVYALVRQGGRIAQIDAATGEMLGWAAGEGYDRMVGVVPW